MSISQIARNPPPETANHREHRGVDRIYCFILYNRSVSLCPRLSACLEAPTSGTVGCGSPFQVVDSGNGQRLIVYILIRYIITSAYSLNVSSLKCNSLTGMDF